MRQLLSVVAVALSISACGRDPVQVCKDQGTVECKKMWSCGSPMKIGSDEASCIQTYDQLCKMASDGKCQNGKPMNVDRAVACTADIEKASCDEYKAGTHKSANCDAVCPG